MPPGGAPDRSELHIGGGRAGRGVPARNAHLFFEDELPAFQGYLIDEADLADMDMPILYIVSESGSGYGMRHHDRLELIRTWLPGTEPLVVPDADHALPVQQPGIIADAVASFVEGQTR